MKYDGYGLLRYSNVVWNYARAEKNLALGAQRILSVSENHRITFEFVRNS